MEKRRTRSAGGKDLGKQAPEVKERRGSSQLVGARRAASLATKCPEGQARLFIDGSCSPCFLLACRPTNNCCQIVARVFVRSAERLGSAKICEARRGSTKHDQGPCKVTGWSTSSISLVREAHARLAGRRPRGEAEVAEGRLCQLAGRVPPSQSIQAAENGISIESGERDVERSSAGSRTESASSSTHAAATLSGPPPRDGWAAALSRRRRNDVDLVSVLHSAGSAPPRVPFRRSAE